MMHGIGLLLFLFLWTETAPKYDTIKLANGFQVALDSKSNGSRIELKAYFRGGTLTEEESQRGISFSVLDILSKNAERKRMPVQVGLGRELFSLSFETNRNHLERDLRLFAELLWRDNWTQEDRLTAQTPSAQVEALGFSEPEYFHNLLDRLLKFSRYRQSRFSYPRREFSMEELNNFRKSYFHPVNGILVISGLKSSTELQKSLEDILGKDTFATFCASFSIVDDFANSQSKTNVVFAKVSRVQLFAVFPAPARGAKEWEAFHWLQCGFREKWRAQNLNAWAGIGCGLFWVSYETTPEKFSEVFPRFLETVEETKTEFMEDPVAKLQALPASLLYEGSFSAVSRPSQDDLALEFFWGIGPQSTFSLPALDKVSTQKLRDTLRAYLNQSYAFVFWPEEKKQDWPGWPLDNKK